MAKSSPGDSLETVARLLDIVPFLTTHQGIALEKLASKFEVTIEQMTKDLTTLWMCGLPGYTAYELIDLSFDSGFVTISNAQTLERPRSLSRDEVLALLLGLETLRESVADSDQRMKETIQATITRLTKLVDASISRRVQSGDPSPSLHLASLERGINEGSSVLIKYHSMARDEITEREIFPLEIMHDDKFSYVHAFCVPSRGYRTFRLDRIVSLVPAQRESQTENIYAKSTQTSTSATFKVNISASERWRDLVERFNLGGAHNSGEFQAPYFNEDWVAREIMSLGGSAHVLEPDSIRSLIAERSKQALRGYEEPSA